MTSQINIPSGIRVDGNLVVGSPALTTGKVWFVSSTSTNCQDDPSHGKLKARPFATLDYAVGRISADNGANRGDVVYVMPNHAETHTAAAGADLDVAGLRVIGLGEGNDRPTFTFTTDTAADWDIDAAGITVENCIFVCGIDSQTAMVDVNSTDFTLRNCEFRESSATGLTCVDINGGAANACDRAKIQGCRFHCITAANWDRAIELGEVADGVEITDCVIFGDFDDAGIHNVTGKVLTNLTLSRNSVQNIQTGDHAIELVSACTGFAFDNRLVTDARATAFDAGALSGAGNLWNISTGGDSEGVPVNPVADETVNYIGTDDSDNAATTSNVAANENGSILERLEQIQEAVNIGTGTSLASNKSLVDALGTDGTTVSDAAVSVLGAIGANNANNAFSSSSVVASADGSVLERLEAIMDPTGAYVPGYGYRVTKTSVMTGTADDIFDFTGPILATLIYGEVTTVLATATTVKLNIKTDGVDLCAATTITSDADGTMYMCTGDTGAILNGADAPVLRLAQTSGVGLASIVIGNSGVTGVIEQTTDQAGTGAILWTIYYLPLASGATVTASA